MAITKAKCKLSGTDGNAFAILGTVQKAMRKVNVDETIVSEFMTEAMSGDYDHLLQTACKYVEVS